MQRASTTALQLSRKWNHTQAQRLLPRTTASAICAQAQAQHATTPRPPIANVRRVLVSAWDPREVVPWYLEEMDTDQQNLDERQLKDFSKTAPWPSLDATPRNTPPSVDFSTPHPDLFAYLYSPHPPTPLICQPSSPSHAPPLLPLDHSQAIASCLTCRDISGALAAFDDICRNDHLSNIQNATLHLLIELLTKARVPSRRYYHYIHHTVSELRRRDPLDVREWEWNALIAAAGSGLRNTTLRDYQTALGHLKEWKTDIRNYQENTTEPILRGVTSQVTPLDDGHPGATSPGHPSLHTYNILLGIATRAESSRAFSDALHRLRKANYPFDACTIRTLIEYNGRTGRLKAIPGLIARLPETGSRFDIGTANRVLYAYARQNRLDVAQELYDLITYSVRHNRTRKRPKPKMSPSNPLHKISEALIQVRPNYVTFTCMIQAYAYHGQIGPALTVFRRLLLHLEMKAKDASHVVEIDQHITTAFRALFHGFVKQSSRGPFAGMTLPQAMVFALQASNSPDAAPPPSPFSLETLMAIFHSYISLSTSLSKPSRQGSERGLVQGLPRPTFVRLILFAVLKTAGDDPGPVLQNVWETLVQYRFMPCREWESVKSAWSWEKLRRDFGVFDLAEHV